VHLEAFLVGHVLNLSPGASTSAVLHARNGDGQTPPDCYKNIDFDAETVDRVHLSREVEADLVNYSSRYNGTMGSDVRRLPRGSRPAWICQVTASCFLCVHVFPSSDSESGTHSVGVRGIP